MNSTPEKESTVFLRPTSGLVKAAGLWDVFIYNVGLISVGIGLAYTQRFGPAYYPHASISVATLLAMGLMVAVVLAFWAWTTVIPRSGGIYVFLTRAQFPMFGFALSFVECISWLFYVAIAARLIVTVGIIPLIALIAGPHAVAVIWLSSPLGQLLPATTTIWVAAYLLIRGTGPYLLSQRILFVVALLGTLALIAVLANPPTVFRHNFNGEFAAAGPDAYSQVSLKATQLGWQDTSTHSFPNDILLLVWPFLPLIGSAFSIGIGGEVKNSARNQILGMLGSLFFCAGLFIVVAILSDGSIGTDFQGAIAFNYDQHDGRAFSTPFEPYFPYFAGLATDNVLLRLVIPVSFICWVWFWIPGVLAYTERAFLAWALDRVAPSSLGTLHHRYSTPYIAVILGAVLAEIFLLLILFTEFFATLVFILAGAVAWCLALVFGIAFPYTRPHIFNKSTLAGKTLATIPLMPLLCALGAVALGFVVFLLWNDPVAAGHSPASVAAIVVTFALGFCFHWFMRVWRARQGIDVGRAYREIPVE